MAITARSCFGSTPFDFAGATSPFGSCTWIEVAPSTTCALVTIVPFGSITMPVPAAEPSAVEILMRTTAGWMRASTA